MEPTRRDITRGAALTAVATAAGLGTAQAQSYVDEGALSFADFDRRAVTGILNQADPVALPGYRLGFVVRSGINAITTGGRAMAQMDVELGGLDLQTARSIADAALADFTEQVRATGRPIIGLEEIRAQPAYRDLKLAPVPWTGRIPADARTFAYVAPNNHDLFFINLDVPNDQGAFGLTNPRAFNKICAGLGAITATPTLVIDFAELTRSGGGAWSGSASTGARPGLFMPELVTGGLFHFGRNAMAGGGNRTGLQKRVRLGDAGQMIQTSSANNQAEIAWWNSSAAMGVQGPGSPNSYSMAAYRYQIDRAVFRERVLAGARALNRAMAQALAENRPRR
ncbi:MAG: hypothetical protein JNM47_10250 [Hyphomonadaceae bacterium]|nr:hypothetical protein [Hyphomonadaceae bacterium]